MSTVPAELVQGHAGTGSDAATDHTVAPVRRAWSLRSRLMWLAALATVFAWLTGGAGVLIAAIHEGEKLYDEQLRALAHEILLFANHEINEITQDGRSDRVHMETAGTLDPRYSYQIWSKDGELLLLSHNARRQPYAPLDQQGMSDRTIDGRTFCVYSARSADGTMTIQVAEDESLRSLFRPNLFYWLLGFFLVSTALLLLVNRWIFGRAVHALDQSARQLTDRSPLDLRPVSADDPPRELRPLLDSINCLFARIGRTLDAERRFTAAAAHELRTPLAAVRMQAQVAGRARSRLEAQTALQGLVSCVDRASRMIDQLLTLAHVETLTSKPGTFAPVRLDHVVEHVVKDLTHAGRGCAKDLDLQLEPATVSTIEFGVAALIRNLIDNAMQHAAGSGRVLVRTFRRDDEVMLIVEDAGPGIPESERQRVFERFYRLHQSDTEGCGVGLSIVQCVAEAHHARVTLDSATGGGLRVTVVFAQA